MDSFFFEYLKGELYHFNSLIIFIQNLFYKDPVYLKVVRCYRSMFTRY